MPINILCYDPVCQNEEYLKATLSIKNFCYTLGVNAAPTWIRYVSLDDGRKAGRFFQHPRTFCCAITKAKRLGYASLRLLMPYCAFFRQYRSR
jgi:hypothetical protein